jgi:chemotaxis protein MotB
MKKTVFMISLVAGMLLTSCASKKELQACQEDNKALQANYQDTKEQLAAANTRVGKVDCGGHHGGSCGVDDYWNHGGV